MIRQPCAGCGHDRVLHHTDGPCVVRHCPCRHHHETETRT
ncbi:hypothetical protein KNV22_gp71 [Gordonia phage Love]|uniref:Uncharacterized protein n=5 Tax=Vividuovirus TaxID=2560251 RepID=A0A3G3MC18_9CAUD|nr:hypothetical protein KNT97_gp67 [Gordonia phage Rofo]YP_010099480.1 hypothetical protein KNU21_gp65 [Gordonia phage Nordenberg]YP_010099648.1 hypothetical protein KNU23_gp69 [Gordonia phage Tangent]YP_010104478.1 hypothetical protein KNU76_gp66 [Gordonia phage Jabberwocky]YP_010109906.1 hypothetical protein KNV22_gp71 [Gordonia phage Love]AYR02470.1 hypothetical protein SEA_AFFECA_67 [Gordonia phage Affeca]UYL87741.1 hypothetical protein SEA_SHIVANISHOLA_66 [Gordonia phage Shivanishola]AX